MSKASKNIRAYLAQRIPGGTNVISVRPGAPALTVEDLEALLSERKSQRQVLRLLQADLRAARNNARQIGMVEDAIPASGGVRAIFKARVYQLGRYNTAHDRTLGHDRQLWAASLALLTDCAALYPFGESSWKGIKVRGRSNQLAHAGACIAAVLDLQLHGLEQ